MDVVGVSSGHEVQACAARQPHHSRHGVREPAARPHPAASWPPSCPPDRPPTCPQHTGNEQIGTQGEQADGGRRSVAGWLSPDSARVGYRSGAPERIFRGTWAKRCPPSLVLEPAPSHNRGSQPPYTISPPRRPARPAGRAGRPHLFGGCPGRLLLAVRHSKPPRVPLRADLPLHGPHAHQRGARIHAQHAPTAARRHSSGRQPMHLIDERPPEPRSKHGMALVAVQAPLLPPKDALLRGCSVTVIVAGAELSVL